MASQKTRELSSMSEEGLNARLAELRKELIKINGQVATGTTPKNPGQIKVMKKTIARILTILNQKKHPIKPNKEVGKKHE